LSNKTTTVDEEGRLMDDGEKRMIYHFDLRQKLETIRFTTLASLSERSEGAEAIV
jgi:hypothetical protein